MKLNVVPWKIGAAMSSAVAIATFSSAVVPRSLAQFNLPGLGSVRFHAITRVPVGERPRIECLGPGGDLLASVRIGEAVLAEDDTSRAFQLLERTIGGLPDSMIIAAVATTHGSGINFQVTCFAAIDGKLKVLRERPIEFWNDGGIFIGDLSDGRGPGVAIWRFLWDDCHACPSRYAVLLYPWNAEIGAFSETPSDSIVTDQKYDNGLDALYSLGLPFNNMLYDFEGLKDYW
jgi:hypothetical protein